MELFNPDILNLSKPELEDELKHLKYVAMLALANYLVERRQELAHWKAFLPLHHAHPQSHIPLQEAHVRLEPLLNYKVVSFLSQRMVCDKNISSSCLFTL